MAFNLKSKNFIPLPGEKKQQSLFIVLFFIVLIGFIVLYFGYFRSAPSVADLPPSGVDVFETESIIQGMEFDASFLKNPDFQSLELYGEWPLSIEETGRANPFLPY
jgi:hypothetical protein